jgi:hypothetical protein
MPPNVKLKATGKPKNIGMIITARLIRIISVFILSKLHFA